MNKLQVELVKLQKAVERKARKLHKDAEIISISVRGGYIAFVHVHIACTIVSYRITGAISIKQVLQRMTEENSF